MANELTGYDLSRAWFDFCFENPDKTNTNQTALYFFIIEHCNRLGWKDKFGLPTTMTMEALSIKSYNTYKEALGKLVEHGFIKMIEKSKNQYSSNIVALSKNNKAPNKALDKAFIKHTSKQVQSNDSIDKPITINKEPLESRKLKFADTLKPFLESYGKETLNKFYQYWIEPNKSKTKMRWELQKTWDTNLRLKKWAGNNFDKIGTTKAKGNYSYV